MEVSALSVTTTLLLGAGCFAIGYILAESRAEIENRRLQFGSCNRFFSWMRSAVTRKKRSEVESADAPAQKEVQVPDEDDGEEEDDAGHQRKRRPRQMRPRLKLDQSKGALLEVENLAEVLEDFKMVLVVRNDLKMGKGKIAAQCSHATLGLYKKLHHRAPKALARWEMCGQVKVVLKIENEEDLLILQARAKSLKLPNHVTIDAGRTQIAPNSRTVMAILGPTDMVDDVTGGLKLL